MAQAMATAQGFSAPAFGGVAALPPLACPLPGEAQGRNPRITTATALVSLLVHAGVALLLLREPVPTPPAAAPQMIVPAISLTWTAPPAPAPAPVPVQPAAEVLPEPVPAEAVEPVAEASPPVLTAAAVTDLSVPPPVIDPAPAVAPAPKPQPREKIPVEKTRVERTQVERTQVERAQVERTLAEKAPARPRPVVKPVLKTVPPSPAPVLTPAPVPAPDLPAAAAPSAPAGPAAAAPAPVSLPVPAEPSLLRGEDGVPVSRDARYLEPPKPPEYPRRAVQLGLEGTVVVRALVEGGGVPRTVRIVTGSGVDSLDAAAIRAVSGWKFAVSDHGSLWVEIPVQFRLR